MSYLTSLRYYNTGCIELQIRIIMLRGDVVKRKKIVSDPLGSYTGVPEEPNEKPTQDADDL